MTMTSILMAQLPCLECGSGVQTYGFQTVKTVFKPGQEIEDKTTNLNCPWAIQIGSYRELITAPKNIVVIKRNGLYKYFIFKFYTTKNEAKKDLSEVRKKYPNAFITTFNGFGIFR